MRSTIEIQLTEYRWFAFPLKQRSLVGTEEILISLAKDLSHQPMGDGWTCHPLDKAVDTNLVLNSNCWHTLSKSSNGSSQ